MLYNMLSVLLYNINVSDMYLNFVIHVSGMSYKLIM